MRSDRRVFLPIRCTIGALCLLVLASCSLANFVADESIDYNGAVEAVTDDILVTNILRGRDQAPLFFSDLSQIRGSIQFNLSAQSAFPWGPMFKPITGTGARRSGQIGPITLQNSPTFDVAPLNTKQFYQGMIEPLSKGILASYLQTSIPKKVILHMFISRIDTVKVASNSARVVSSCRYFQDCFAQTIVRWTSHSLDPVVVAIPESKDVGPPVAADAKAVVAAAAAGLDVKPAGKLVQFSKKSPHVTLCVSDTGNRYVAVGLIDNSVIKTPESTPPPKSDDDCNPDVSTSGTSPSIKRHAGVAQPATRYMLRLRSVKEIFYYLGYLLTEEGSKHVIDGTKISPMPFHIYRDAIRNARFSVEYRGQRYYISEVNPDESDPTKADRTITILAILNDLLNLNRDANAIPTTKAVQSVGG